MKILNLYAGIGGNRKLWENVEVTAVEHDSEIAMIYQDLYPNDTVIVGDAHEYLLKNFKNFDFIWTSPPCPSHSKFRFMTTKMSNEKYKREILYPDMNLYQEIILLESYFEGKYVVENVQGYYKPLITPQKSGRHYFWANFNIGNIKTENENFIKKTSIQLTGLHDFDLTKYKIKHRKDQILRNCVDPKIGLYLLNCAMQSKQKVKQAELWGLFAEHEDSYTKVV